MKEKDLYPLFRKKLEELKFIETCVFELKIVKTKRFPLSSVHEHQVEGLLGAIHGLTVRIVDQPFVAGGFQQKKNFDMIWFKNSQAYVVPVWYIPRQRKTAYLIPIKEFIKLKVKSVIEEDLSRFVRFDI